MFGIIISGLVISPAAARRLFQRHCCTKQCTPTCPSAGLETPCPPTCDPTPCEPVDCTPVDCLPVDCASAEIVDAPPASQDFVIEPTPLVEAPTAPVAPEAKEELETPRPTSESPLVSTPVEPAEPASNVVQPHVQPELTEPVVEGPVVDSVITPTAEVEPATPSIVGDRYATEPIAPPVSAEPAPVEPQATEPTNNEPVFSPEPASDSAEELFKAPAPFVEKEFAVEVVEPASVQEPEMNKTPAANFESPSDAGSNSALQDEIDTESLFGPSSSESLEVKEGSLEEASLGKKPAEPVGQPIKAEQPKQSLPVFQSPKSIESPAPQPEPKTAAGQEDVDSVFGPSSASPVKESPAQPVEKSKEIKQPKKNKQPEPKTPAKEESEESYDPFGEDDIFSQNEQTTILSEPGGLYSSAARTWTDETAKHQCQARLVRVTSNRVILQRATGAKLAVPFACMAASDLHFVREQLTALQIVQTRKADAEKLASVMGR